MLGKRIFILSALAAAAYAAEPDYFPLQPGNTWVFSREGSGEARAIQVLALENVAGAQYARAVFLGRQVLLRVTPDGILTEWADGRAKPWVRFNAGEGERFPTDLFDCNRAGAQIESRQARVRTRAGEFTDVLRVVFQPSCADAGITSLLFAPGLGPIEIRETTIAGERVYTLAYSHVGVTELTAGSVEFRLSLDATQYPLSGRDGILARLTLANSTADPLKLTFLSGQTYELAIRNDQGQEVYRWSLGKAFTQQIRVEEFLGERNWLVTVPAQTSGGFPAGRYFAEAYLITEGGKRFAASVPFEVRDRN